MIMARLITRITAPSVILTLAVAVALIAAVKAVPYVTLWFDEATFFVNIRDTAWTDVLRPLAYYDQAATFGYVVLTKLLYQLFGLNEYVLRTPSLLAFAGVLLLSARFPGLNRLEAALFSLMLLSSQILLQYSFQTKPYLVEFFFILLVLRAFIANAESRDRAILTPCWITCLAIPFVNQLLIVLLALGIALLTKEMPRHLDNIAWPRPVIVQTSRTEGAPILELEHSLSRMIQLMAPLAISGLAALLVYWFVVRPAVAPLLKNYRYLFDFGFPNGISPAFYVLSVLKIIKSHYSDSSSYAHIIAICITLGSLAALGFVIAIKRKTITSLAFVWIPLVVLTLNLSGQVPILSGRFSDILLPSFAYTVAVGTSLIFERLPRVASHIFIAIVVATILISPLQFAHIPRGQQAKKTIAFARTLVEKTSGDGAQLAVTLGSQPILDAYLPSLKRLRGYCFNTPANTTGWTNRCTSVRNENQQIKFSDDSTPWVVMNYIASGGRSLDVAPEQVDHWTSEYFRFLHRSVCIAGEADVAVVHFEITDALISELARDGQVQIVLNENRRPWTHDGVIVHYLRDKRANCAPMNE
jgi:hypothetical protein